MSRSRTVRRNGYLDTTIRAQGLTLPDIHAYISSLKERYAKSEITLAAGRKVIDEAMKTASLTTILYETRKE